MAKRSRVKPIVRDSPSVRFDYHALGDAVPVQAGEFFTHRSGMRGFDEEFYIALNETERTVTARRVILVPDSHSATGLKWSPTGLPCIFQRSDCQRAALSNPAAYATVRKVAGKYRKTWINDPQDQSRVVVHTDDDGRLLSVEIDVPDEPEVARVITKQKVRKPKARSCFQCFNCSLLYDKHPHCPRA